MINGEDGGGQSVTYLLIQRFKRERPPQNRMKVHNKGREREGERKKTEILEKDSEHKDQHDRGVKREVENCHWFRMRRQQTTKQAERPQDDGQTDRLVSTM